MVAISKLHFILSYVNIAKDDNASNRSDWDADQNLHCFENMIYTTVLGLT